jgi:hypothetical protein
MSNTTPDQYRGFLINAVDTSANIWDAESTYTVQNPIPSNPATAGSYDLGVTAAGTFTETEPLQIQTNRAGHIGHAGFVWKEQSQTDYYGADTAAAISKWESIIDASTGSIERVLLGAVSNRDGTAAFLYEQTSGSSKSIVASHLSLSQSLTSNAIFTQTASAPALQGCLCTLEDGSILAIYMQANNAENVANVRTSRSYDGGLTWFEISKRALPLDVDIGGTYGAGNTGLRIYKMSAAAARGEILLVLGTYAHNTSLTYMEILEQYSSTDNGGTFVHIGNTGGDVSRYYHPVILSRANQFYLIAIESPDSAVIVEVENSTEPIKAARAFGRVEITNAQVAGNTSAGGGNYLDHGSIDAWIDENNRMYAAFYNHSGEGQGNSSRFFILQSDNPLKVLEWYYLGYRNVTSNKPSQAQFVFTGDADSRPRNIRCAGVRGTQYVFHDYFTKTSAYDNGIHLYELGGYSTVNLPALVNYPADYNFANWDITWLPYDAPDATNHWTKTGTGTITAAATHAQFDTISTQTSFVQGANVTTDATTQGIIIRTRCKPITEGEANRGRGIYAQTTTRRVSVYIAYDALYLYDEEAGTQLATVTVDPRQGIEIILAMTTTARAWYRIDDGVNKRWSELGNGSLAAGTNTAAFVRFGHISPLSLGHDPMRTEWYEMHYSYADRTGLQLVDGQQNPEELVNKLYPPTGLTCYISGGTKISTYDGAAYQGETYTISEDSQHPLRRVMYSNSPTPRAPYKSANDNSMQTLAFYWDSTTEDDANMHLGTDSIAVHLQNINFKDFIIEEYDKDTTSWVNTINIENAIDGNKNYERKGNSITCTDNTGVFLHENELAGCYFFIDATPDKVRKIKGNTAGRLASTSGGSKQAVIILEDAQNTDPTTISGYIVSNQCTVIIHQKGNRSAAFRIKIPAQETNEGFFIIGTLTAGPLHVSRQYSRGRTQTFNAGSLETETQDATIRTREAHKGYRTQRISWAEGIDLSSLYDTNPEPDYYQGTAAAGGQAIATPAATPTNIFGLARENNNAAALLFLPVISYSSASHEIINRYHDNMLCRLQGETSIEHVLGSENQGGLQGEVYRVASLVLREII